MNSTRTAFYISSAMFVALASTTAHAESSEDQVVPTTNGIEELVVTARKRDETLTDAPLAITAFSDAQIKAAGIVDVRNLNGVAPGLTIVDAGGNGAGGRAFGQIYIRPLPPTLPLPRTQTGALFVDGVYVLGSVSSVDTSDVARIEVIKGPQSALFGRNTFGGAINFVTKRPGNDFAASFDGSATTRDSYRASLSVEGPLIKDAISARLTGTLYKKGAHYTANDGGKLGEESSKSIALTLSATPLAGLTARLRGSYQRDEDGLGQETFLRANLYGSRCDGQTFNARTNTGTPVTYTGFNVNHFCGTVPTLGQLGSGVVSQNTLVTPPFLATIGIPNKLLDILGNRTTELAANRDYLPQILNAVPSLNKLGLARDIIRVSGDVQYEFDNDMSVSAIVGYNETNQNTAFDKDHTDTQNQWSIQPTTYKDFSAEFRISGSSKKPFRWALGASYSELEYFTQELTYIIRNLPTQPISTVASINATGGEKARVWGIFGSAEYDITDKLMLSLEGRFQNDRSDVAPHLVLQGRAAAPKFTFKAFLPRAIVRFKPDGNTTLYASYSRGVLPGQGNAQYLAATAYQQQQIVAQFPGVKDVTPQQKLDSYEAGIKQRLFDGKFEYSLSAYYMQWRNIFASGIVTVPTSATNSTPFVFNNIFVPGSANLWGLEFDANFRLSSKLSGRLTAAWQDNKYNEIFGTSVTYARGYVRFDGNKIPRIPDLTGSVSLTYRDALTDEWDWYVRGDARYVGKAYDTEANTAQFNDYARVNLRLGFERDNLTTELFVNNVLDDKNWDFGFRSTSLAEPGYIFGPAPFQSGVIARAPDRRELGVRVRVKY